MGKAGQVLLNENTRVIVSFTTLASIIVLIVSVVIGFYTIKTDMDVSINSLQKADIRIEQKFDDSVYDLKESDRNIILDQKEDRAIVLEVRTQLSGIQTDLKWLIADTKSRQ